LLGALNIPFACQPQPRVLPGIGRINALRFLTEYRKAVIRAPYSTQLRGFVEMCALITPSAATNSWLIIAVWVEVLYLVTCLFLRSLFLSSFLALDLFELCIFPQVQYSAYSL